VQVPLLYVDLSSFGYMPKSGIAGSMEVIFLAF
jgi:hypothetical protein